MNSYLRLHKTTRRKPERCKMYNIDGPTKNS